MADAFVDKYTLMSTEELVSLIKKWHGDTKEALERRDAISTELENAENAIEEIESTYLLEKRGEHQKYRKKPKSYMLDKENAKKEATELIYKIALEGVRQELGDDAVALYKKNPHRLIGFLASKGINFYALRNDLVLHRRNFRNLDSYKKFKRAMISVDALVEEQHVENELASDHKHYDKLLELTNKEIAASNVELRKGVEARYILEHLKQHLRSGKFNTEYLETYNGHFKKKK